MEDIIVIAVLAVIIGLAGLYIYKSKKRGQKCIGCPYGGNCSSHNASSSCSCNCNSDNK